MWKSILLLTACATLAWDLPARDRKTRSPEVTVLEMTVTREEDTISVEGRVKNASGRAIQGLNVIFRFEDGEQRVVTTQRLKIDEASLAPGGESAIEGQLKNVPEAAQARILAQTGAGADLHVGNDGPFPIQ